MGMLTMSDKTGIEWADATWNPTTGCEKVSPGCDNCYALTFAERWRGVPGHYFEHGFDVQLRPDKLDMPLRWRKPRRIFVNSMSDLFHKDIPDEYIARVFVVMALASQHTFQILTKRHARMRSLVSSQEFRDLVRDAGRDLFDLNDEARYVLDIRTGVHRWPLPNVWLGVSVESQRWADIRIPALLDTPGAVRFLSCEPLLGPVDTGLNTYNGNPPLIDWIIAGGESGPGARPMHPAWARSLRDQAAEHGAAFHFKQWGEWLPFLQVTTSDLYQPIEAGRRQIHNFGDGIRSRRVGKKTAGRLLDGREWSEFPAVAS
jgi:protein gp37